MPELGGARRGDLYVQLEVQIPETLTARQRDLYEQLRAHERNGTRKRPARRPKQAAPSPTTPPASSAAGGANPTT